MIRVIRINSKSDKGFTLVELLVAVTILVIAAAAFLPVLTLVARSNNQNKIRATAGAIAAGIYEEISGMDFDKIDEIGNDKTDNTQAESPPGVTYKTWKETIDDTTYNVEVLITWGITEDASGEEVSLSHKNVRVIVSAVNTFTGKEEVVDKVYSIVAKEGGQTMPDAGNMRVTVKQAYGLGHEFPVFNIKCSGPETFTMRTDEAGQVIFGEIKKGTYRVSTSIPSGWSIPQGYEVNGNTVSISDIPITEWKVKDVYFYMDKPEKFCNLTAVVVDENGEVINTHGKMTLTWEIDGQTRVVFKDKELTGGNLDINFFGKLWPLGKYNIKIDFPADSRYRNYDMTEDNAFIENTSEIWSGTFNNFGERLSILIPLKSDFSGPTTLDAFSRIEAEDTNDINGSVITEDCTDRNGGKNLRINGNGGYVIYKNISFGNDLPYTFQARVAATGSQSSKIRIKLRDQNGPVLGTLYITPTGSLNRYKTVTCVIAIQKSVQNAIDRNETVDICLDFEADHELNLNWFKFSKVLDDFNRSSVGSEWKSNRGNWTIENGILKQTSTGSNLRQLVLNKDGFDNNSCYSIVCKVKVDFWRGELLNTPRAGISLFSDSHNSGYGLTYDEEITIDWRNLNLIKQKRMGIIGENSEIYLKDYDWDNNWYWFMLSSYKIGSKTVFEGKIWKFGEVEPDWMFFHEVNNTNLTGYPSLFTIRKCTASFDDISVINNDSTE